MTRHKVDPLRVLRTPATRPDLHALVDKLPDEELNEAARYLTGLATVDPVVRALLLAPLEDEELQPEELEAIEAGRQAYERGEYVADAPPRPR
jgi:hypothetical protein